MSRRYEHVKRESFIKIARQQIESNLSIEDFCSNNGYKRSSFYYWRKKYHIRSTDTINHEPPFSRFTPINIKNENNRNVEPSSIAQNISCSSESTKSDISIEFPNGLKLQFNGTKGCDAAMGIISKLYNTDVLSR